jgi:tRNA (guanine37-N1)-methyltransferase
LWRRKESLKETLEKRPDLLKKAKLTPEDRAILAELL